ncbi:PQQ-dependent sugar dehydrogenase [Hansschlegelia quercus]|uniref:Sorbosone dehydrogenase family protein n=1 Tax=Hansschlegelia quercus TaxID=2528245 RepID=A0A4Q9GNA6_9HYPH|nr:PQQ-dependent sugar dehydrogenase [Hansschlegelia quercus]TBN53320.1 sorbosone dehydrogenase family protein [Hansschlegelia quercus]
MRGVLSLISTALAAAALLCAGQVFAADKLEDFWSVGRPKPSPGFTLAPPSAFPVATSADALPTPKLRVPQGFKVETWASDVLDARMMRLGDKGTVFVSSLFVANRVYAIVDHGDRREVKTIASGLSMPNGLEFRNGALYVATPKQILRYDDIENRLDNPPQPVVVYDKFPGEGPHGWKFLKFGPDGRLYAPVGAPCNICVPDKNHARILSMTADGQDVRTVAEGVRNTVGFDFDPRTGDLWFTDNQRDWISDDMPLDELNHVTKPGQHFGFPYCHSGLMVDPEVGQNRSCREFVSPAALLGPHAAPLGMRFYTGTMFPQQFHDAIFIARHGPWNRAQKGADVAVAYLNDRREVLTVEPFLTGFVENNDYLGRPVDVLVMKDGSLLVSDDHNGAIYRVSATAEGSATLTR